MEENKPSVSYSPAVAGLTSAITNFFIAPVGGAAGYSVILKVFKKKEFVAEFKEAIKDKWIWAVGAVFAAWNGYSEFKYARHVQAHNDQLYADNIAMRGQLNQTGQILQQVAGQIERGHVHNDSIQLSDSAPPSHEAQARAAQAEQALAKATTRAHALPTLADAETTRPEGKTEKHGCKAPGVKEPNGCSAPGMQEPNGCNTPTAHGAGEKNGCKTSAGHSQHQKPHSLHTSAIAEQRAEAAEASPTIH